MKWLIAGFASVALAVFCLSIFTTQASANRMNGKGGWCSEGMNCMSDRAKAAMAKSRKY
jgi:hypothetical protein